MADTWSVHDAKQQFSRVVRAAADEPQVISRHGREVAVVMDIASYRKLAGDGPDLKALLLEGPKIDDLDELIARDRTPYVGFEFDDGELWKD